MRQVIKRVRDTPFVLSSCVLLLRGFRAIGVFTSRDVYIHVPFRGTFSVDCGQGRSFRMISRGHKIENGLYWDGLRAHEPESIRFWIDRAATAGVVLDVGANSGLFALAAAAVGAGEVHAFEPLPRVHAILAGNVASNPQLPLQAWPVAVGAFDGVADLFDPGGEAPSSASLSPKFAAEHFDAVPVEKVDVMSIDSFCAGRGIDRVDLIKIDVEGYEVNTLRGMQRIVAASSPAILMEVLPGQEAELRETVETLWPGKFAWSPVDEGNGDESRNVTLVDRRAGSQTAVAGVHG